MRTLLTLTGLWLVGCLPGFAQNNAAMEEEETSADVPAKIVVIPIRQQIDKPILYILRRGVKEAIADGTDTIILDMETPGGRVDVTMEILKALERFPGKTVTFVNSEAISAGALIAAGTDEIYFTPRAVIGAAAPVLMTGGDLDKTMRAKQESVLTARARSVSEGKEYRGEVVTAMISVDYELKIGDEVIKPKGELLSLTATEAIREYGDPPKPLLGSGISENLTALMDRLHGEGNYTVKHLEITWSEKLAQYLTAMAPILMAIGLVLIVVEFKTPGFGVFGVGGAAVLALVFFGHFTAGLSGHEAALLFAVGLALVAVEVFFLPGTIIFALTGAVLMLGALMWSMVDHWPSEPLNFSAEVFSGPLINMTIGVVLALVIFLLIIRFLPRGGLWGKMVLQSSIGGNSQEAVLAGYGPDEAGTDPLIGQSGIAVTTLYPSGQVEIDGKRYEARLPVGFAEAGTTVRVKRRREFGLEVEVITP